MLQYLHSCEHQRVTPAWTYICAGVAPPGPSPAGQAQGSDEGPSNARGCVQSNELPSSAHVPLSGTSAAAAVALPSPTHMHITPQPQEPEMGTQPSSPTVSTPAAQQQASHEDDGI